MSKKSKIISVICAVIVVIIICLLSIHTSFTDRINPFISQEISYARVPTGIQKYEDVEVRNPKTKKLLSYKIKRIQEYDPTGKYILVKHKGQYVKSIKYISKKQFTKADD